MRNERQSHIDRAVIKSIRDGGGRLIIADAVITSARVKADYLEPRPNRSEVEESLRYAEDQGRVLGVVTETGNKYKLTEAGEAWALEVRL